MKRISWVFAAVFWATNLVPAFAQTPAENSVYSAGTFDDWEIQCQALVDQTDVCRMIQSVIDDNGNQVSQVTVQALPTGPDATARLVFAAPLETFLPGGLTISIDDGQTLSLPFENCAVNGCFARLVISPEQLDAFIKGGALNIVIVPLANRSARVVVAASLKGFTAAFEQLEVQIAE